MFSHIRNVFLISSAALLGGFIKNVLIARELSKEDVGLISLLFTIVAFVNPLTILGQQNALVRFLGNENLHRYDWSRQIRRSSTLSVLITGIAVFVAVQIYDLTNLAMLYLFVAIIASALLDLLASVSRARGDYEISILMFRGLSFFQPIILALLLLFDQLTLSSALISLLALHGLYGLAMAIRTGSQSTGSEAIPPAVWKDGLYFWGADLSLLIILSVDKFFIPKILDYEALGGYFAIYSIMRLFDLALKSIEFVLLPNLRKRKEIRLASILSKVAGVGLGVSLFYLVAGKPLVHILFKGKFDSVAYLIPMFCVLGMIRLVHVIPFSIIGGAMSQNRLKQMFYLNLIISGVCILLSFFFIKHFQLMGAVLAAIIIWGIKTLTGFGLIFIEQKYVDAPLITLRF